MKKDFLRHTEKLVEELGHYVTGESKKKRVVVRQGSGLGVKFYPSLSNIDEKLEEAKEQFRNRARRTIESGKRKWLFKKAKAIDNLQDKGALRLLTILLHLLKPFSHRLFLQHPLSRQCHLSFRHARKPILQQDTE